MKTETPTTPLAGFEFEKDHRANALLLLHWLHVIAKNPNAPVMPAVLISGPPGSGKTELLHRCMEEAGIPAEHVFSRVESWCFDRVAALQPKVLCFDLGADRGVLEEALNSSELAQWVGSKLWSVRPVREVQTRQVGINCVTVLMHTGFRGMDCKCCGAAQPLAERRDVLHIRLKERGVKIGV